MALLNAPHAGELIGEASNLYHVLYMLETFCEESDILESTAKVII